MARRSTKARRSAQRRKINVEALNMIRRKEMSLTAYTSAVATGTLPALVRNVRTAVEAERRRQVSRTLG